MTAAGTEYLEHKAAGSRRGSLVQSLKAVTVHTEEKRELEERQLPGFDYSGAHAKTNPEEIKLVKKLDRWIMVCFLPFSS
jgi:hypothetical protein